MLVPKHIQSWNFSRILKNQSFLFIFCLFLYSTPDYAGKFQSWISIFCGGEHFLILTSWICHFCFLDFYFTSPSILLPKLFFFFFFLLGTLSNNWKGISPLCRRNQGTVHSFKGISVKRWKGTLSKKWDEDNIPIYFLVVSWALKHTSY